VVDTSISRTKILIDYNFSQSVEKRSVKKSQLQSNEHFINELPHQLRHAATVQQPDTLASSK